MRMNRKAALDRFVGENGRELSDTRATKDHVRLLRQRFAVAHNLDSATRFTQRECAERVVEDLVHANKDSDIETVVALARRIPWIADALGEGQIRQQVEINRLGAQPVLSTTDLTRLNEENYLSSVEEKIAEKVRVVASRQLAEEQRQLARTLEVLAAKQADLQAKSSVLESLPPEKALALEKDEEIQAESPVPAAVWWQDIGLSSDPFLTNRGIYHIPKDKFDSIVVETEFIRRFSDRIAKSARSFFSQAVLILGRYGSGKSTLFDILERKASSKGIIPLLVELSPTPSAPGMLENFFSQLGAGLGEAFPDTFGGQPVHPSESADEMGACIQAMKAALKGHSTTIGYYILVDGLHKPDIFRTQTYEFLQYLQTFEERLDRGSVPCGFFIAGLPAWSDEISAMPAVKGSISEIAPIPDLEVENAVEAVVRRISSFALPGTPPPQILRLPLRRGFQVLKERLRAAPTFRDYLDDVKARLVARDYASVGLSINLHLETIQAVKQTFEDSPLRAAYNRLMDPKLHSGTFRNALKLILPAMVSQGGIPETASIFTRNIGAFYVLRSEGFIVKRWDEPRGGVVWHIAESVIPLLKQLEAEQEVLPSEALEALFVDSRVLPPVEAGSIYGSVLRQLRDMATTWKGTWDRVTEYVDNAERKIREISNSVEADQSFSLSTELVRGSTTDLALGILEAIGEPATGADDIAKRFEECWCAPEDADEIARLIRLSPKAASSLPAGLGILHRHAGVARTLCDLLTDLVSGEGVARLRERRLSDEEKRVVHEARTAFLAQQFQTAIDGVNDALERKIRDVAFVRLRCLGPPDPISILPRGAQREIERDTRRGTGQLGRPVLRNFLYDIPRLTYSRVLLLPGIRDAVFASVLPEAELKRLGESVAMSFGLGPSEASNDRPRFFLDHSQDISDAIAFCVEFLELLNDSIDQLFDGSRTILRVVVSKGLEATFSLPNGSTRVHTVSIDRAKAIGQSLVDRLKRDRIRIPPIETAMLAVDSKVEDALIVTLAAIQEGRVGQSKGVSPFFIELTLGERGGSAVDTAEVKSGAASAAAGGQASPMSLAPV